jgi:hypothetical protein
MLKKRLAEARLDEVPDPRDRRGRRWPLGTLLRSAVAGLVSGAQGLGDVERTTAELTPAVRRQLGIRRRVPDTTLRDALCKLRPYELRPNLHQVVCAAHRRKALSVAQGLPFGMVSLDGKGTAVPSADDFYAQRQTSSDSAALTGVVRTVTATLTSHPARPCIDVATIPARTNEMGAFESALRGLVEAYDGIDLFRLVSYDVRRVDLTPVIEGFGDWTHLRTVLRVECVMLDPRGAVRSTDNRYFLSSLPPSRLSAAQWLLAARRHWGVETTHQILDVTFHEDDHPWIESNPRATAVVFVLRRIAYTLLALWRFVTLRADEQRTRSWRAILSDVCLALLTATEIQPAARSG